MNKKVLFFVLGFLCLTGCMEKEKVIVHDEFSCVTEDSKFNLVIENGQIVKYIDSVDGELGQETVNILNEEHLVGNTDNDNALKIMNGALADLNGRCEKVIVEE